MLMCAENDFEGQVSTFYRYFHFDFLFNFSKILRTYFYDNYQVIIYEGKVIPKRINILNVSTIKHVSTLLSNLKTFRHGIDWIWYGMFIQNLAISISMYDYIKSSLITVMVNNSTNLNKTNKHIYHLKSWMQKDQRICWWKFDLLILFDLSL